MYRERYNDYLVPGCTLQNYTKRCKTDFVDKYGHDSSISFGLNGCPVKQGTHRATAE